MPTGSQEQKPRPSAKDKKTNGESQRPLTPDEVRAGTKVVMTHAERQVFLKNSRLGQLLGVERWLTEPPEQ